MHVHVASRRPTGFAEPPSAAPPLLLFRPHITRILELFSNSYILSKGSLALLLSSIAARMSFLGYIAALAARPGMMDALWGFLGEEGWTRFDVRIRCSAVEILAGIIEVWGGAKSRLP